MQAPVGICPENRLLALSACFASELKFVRSAMDEAE